MVDEDPRALMKLIKGMYMTFELDPPNAKDYDQEGAELFNQLHADFVSKGFNMLPRGMQKNYIDKIEQGLDSGQPWFIYWLTEALEVLNVQGYELAEEQKSLCVQYLRKCQNPKGGFGGAPYHQSHVASSYAAMLAIVNIGTQEAYDMIDVKGMRQFLGSVKNNLKFADPDAKIDEQGNPFKPTKTTEVLASLPGSFIIHTNGEIDMRGVFCSMVIADLLNILDEDLIKGVGDFISSCQTYEGGISCVPLGEAHGGFTYCGLAALILIKESHKLNLDRLIEWLANRQLTEEGGFNGRINKLVDSCYNFWQGASFELFDIALKGKGNVEHEWLYNQDALQAYTLICCQEGTGGLKDKPMKKPDFYHTCYASSGMSISQYLSDYDRLHSGNSQTDISQTFSGIYEEEDVTVNTSFDKEEHKEAKKEHLLQPDNDKTLFLAGIEQGKLRRIHPVFNTRYDYVAKIKSYFRQQNNQ